MNAHHSIAVGNPGSLLWLTTERPYPNDTCSGVDTYKYGLADGLPAYDITDAKKLGRDGLVARYRGRNAHYAWGLVSFPVNGGLVHQVDLLF